MANQLDILRNADPELWQGRNVCRVVQRNFQPMVFTDAEAAMNIRHEIRGNMLKYRGNYYFAPPESPRQYVGLVRPYPGLGVTMPLPKLLMRPQNLEKVQNIAGQFEQTAEFV